ncbi:MAG: polysaccharide pyruvyl transferase family protein [Acidobacteriota bacterium]
MKQALPQTIALFGYYGAGNLGDEAVVSLLAREIRRRMPEAKLLGISLNPDETMKRHGIEAIPIRRTGSSKSGRSRFRKALEAAPAEIAFLWKSYRALRSITLLVVAGSGGIYDKEHGPWTYPFTHFRWAALCALTGTRMMYLSVGAGPFVTELGKWFFRFSLSRASYRSFRDEASLAWMKKIGMRKASRLCPDMAFALLPSASGLHAGAAKSRLRRVGINPLPRHEWSTRFDARTMSYEAYIRIMAEFCLFLCRKKIEVVFFHSQLGDERLDDDIRAIMAAHSAGGAMPTTLSAASPDELMEHIASLDLVVASRFHAVLFSLLKGKPVVALSYHPKIDDLMERAGQGRHVMEIRTITPEALECAFERLEAERASCAWRLDTGIFKRYYTEVVEQFDDVFSSPKR